ncbi:hypothetical protein ANO11243_046090 [Dothideomycetidae sp. 11243]|nr:hypothetical protein ANO11243_046090 [fungal sp. No.11243]
MTAENLCLARRQMADEQQRMNLDDADKMAWTLVLLLSRLSEQSSGSTWVQGTKQHTRGGRSIVDQNPVHACPSEGFTKSCRRYGIVIVVSSGRTPFSCSSGRETVGNGALALR